MASLTLGQVQKRRAEEMCDKDPQGAARLRKESEEWLTLAAEKYGDVSIDGRKGAGLLVAHKAGRELFELRNLSIGRVAPELSGEDQDGQKIKLSDYRGKVVLLDFWSFY